MQSPEEIKIVTQYWIRNLAPKGFLDTAENGAAIGEEHQRRGYSVVTFETLSEVVDALGDKALGGALAYASKAARSVEPSEEKVTWKAPIRASNVTDINSERKEFAQAVEDLN